MGRISLLDCTLRDGGYINDWHFGADAIKGIISRLGLGRVDYIEIGFLKGSSYDPDYSLFPDTDSCRSVLEGTRAQGVRYVAMLDMSAPVAMECIGEHTDDNIDGIRVIFKKARIDSAFEYCRVIKERGYQLFVNFVSTDVYSDEELESAVRRFAQLKPDGFTVVDTFGLIKRKAFLHYAGIIDRAAPADAILCYHAHNNLQQAFGNAEALCELGLERDIVIDACVFGMGRGAGNLNIELFADDLNENFGTDYRIEPFLEIMDEYLTAAYRTLSWGYSLPFYLTASNGCHPNYGVYYSSLDTLTEKSFNELLKSISPEDKAVFSRDRAEYYYEQYMAAYIDDRDARAQLSAELKGRDIVILAPGRTLTDERGRIESVLASLGPDRAVIALNFSGGDFGADYVFSSNMRRYSKIRDLPENTKRIITSNLADPSADFSVNYSSYISDHAEIIDNSGLMLMRLLADIGIKKIYVAGMDGYSSYRENNYYDRNLEADFSREQDERNRLISGELRQISGSLEICFITSTHYQTAAFS